MSILQITIKFFFFFWVSNISIYELEKLYHQPTRLIRLKSNSASPHCSGIKAVLLEETWLVRKMKGYTDVHLEEKCRRAERKDIVNSFGPDIWALARSWPHYNLSGTSCPASRLSEQLLVCTLYNLPQNPLFFSPLPNLSPDSRWNCLVHRSYEFMITTYFYSYFLIYPKKMYFYQV